MIREYLRRHGVGPWLFEKLWTPTRPWGYGFAGGVRFLLGVTAMKRAATRLPPVRGAAHAPDLTATILTGREYWFQTVFCAHSLASVCPGDIRLQIRNDGTLTAAQARHLARVFPDATLVAREDTVQALEAALPRAKFPLLRAARDHTPLLRKLVDVRAASAQWQLSLDSDMLFFRPPEFLFRCQQARTSCYMLDAVYGYIFSPEQLARLAGCPVPANMNTGLLALRDDEIDWPEIERWCREFTPEQRHHRLLEQSLTAVLLARLGAQAAPADDYVIVHQVGSSRPAGATMAHYIIRGKLPYFTREWREYHGGTMPPSAGAATLSA